VEVTYITSIKLICYLRRMFYFIYLRNYVLKLHYFYVIYSLIIILTSRNITYQFNTKCSNNIITLS